MRVLARTCCLIAVGALWACAEGEEVEPPTGTFGDGTTPTVTATATATSPTTASAPTTSTSASSTGDPANGTEGSESAATGTASGSGTATGDASSSSGPGPSEQPLEGMYSTCESAVECFGLTLCMTINDAGGAVIDGYCTITNCVGPSDCDASPGGTAPSGCFDATVDGVVESVCALSCDGGATCPGGMACYEVSGGSICV